MNDEPNFIKEAVDDAIKHRAVLFHVWMRLNHTGVNDAAKAILLYEDFDKEYKEMQEASPVKEI